MENAKTRTMRRAVETLGSAKALAETVGAGHSGRAAERDSPARLKRTRRDRCGVYRREGGCGASRPRVQNSHRTEGTQCRLYATQLNSQNHQPSDGLSYTRFGSAGRSSGRSGNIIAKNHELLAKQANRIHLPR